MAEFCKIFGQDLISLPLKLFTETDRGTVFPDLFLEASVTLIPKLEGPTKKEKYRPFPLMKRGVKEKWKQSFCQQEGEERLKGG